MLDDRWTDRERLILDKVEADDAAAAAFTGRVLWVVFVAGLALGALFGAAITYRLL